MPLPVRAAGDGAAGLGEALGDGLVSVVLVLAAKGLGDGLVSLVLFASASGLGEGEVGGAGLSSVALALLIALLAGLLSVDAVAGEGEGEGEVEGAGLSSVALLVASAAGLLSVVVVGDGEVEGAGLSSVASGAGRPSVAAVPVGGEGGGEGLPPRPFALGLGLAEELGLGLGLLRPLPAGSGEGLGLRLLPVLASVGVGTGEGLGLLPVLARVAGGLVVVGAGLVVVEGLGLPAPLLSSLLPAPAGDADGDGDVPVVDAAGLGEVAAEAGPDGDDDGDPASSLVVLPVPGLPGYQGKGETPPISHGWWVSKTKHRSSKQGHEVAHTGWYCTNLEHHNKGAVSWHTHMLKHSTAVRVLRTSWGVVLEQVPQEDTCMAPKQARGCIVKPNCLGAPQGWVSVGN